MAMDIRETSGKNLGKFIWDTYGKKEGNTWKKCGEILGIWLETHHNQSCSSPLEVNDSRQGYEIDHTWGVGSNPES